MTSRVVLLSFVALLAAGPSVAQAQVTPPYAEKRVPFEAGFRVYLITDMDGTGSVVQSRETMAGNEGPGYRDRTSPDYWEHYRAVLTGEANAVIRGARAAGARSFVVNEGHGGNRFANILPWDLDPDAILIRGYPKPMVMSTAIDSTFGTVMFIGAHASAGRPGILAHVYAFSDISVDGTRLNEAGINALVAGDMGVPMSLVSGDDELVKEAREILGPQVVGVTVKTAVGRNAAITYSPTRVQRMLEEGAREAVRRVMVGEIKPFTLPKPYRLEFALRPSFGDSVVTAVDGLMAQWKLEKTGARSYRMVTNDARQIAYLLDAIELIVFP